ncbi:DUF3558 family protein [Plantactinospora sp. GCM10030261]|uniref:DUF3558 family protein n=1 Tax=Plantactinospora sp. GCM10030261 TaxID=3273420 RepID=UPI00360840C3
MRRMALVGVVLLGMAGAGCSSDAASPEAPATSAETPVTSAEAQPAGTPGPAVTDACSLVGQADLAPLGLADAKATETKLTETARSCDYQGGGGNLRLFVATEPATGSAESVAKQAFGNSATTAEEVPGLGDFALYDKAPKLNIMVAVRIEGSQQRVYTLMAHTDESVREPMAKLLRTALERS